MFRNKKENIIISIISLFIFILLWYIISIYINIIPNPVEVLNALIIITIYGDNFGYNIFFHIFASLTRVFIGFLYAILLGIPLGIIMGISKKLDTAISTIIEIFRPIPPFAWIPFAIAIFGLGLISQSFIIFIGSFFPILLNTYLGVKNTQQIHIDIAKTLGANQFQIILYIILPSALPSILVGLRIGLGVGWMCVIAAELVGLNIPLGLGYLIQYSAQFGNFGLTIATMLITGLVGYLMNYSIKLIEHYLIKWR